MVTRLRDVLVELTPPHAGETRAELEARVEAAFFRADDPASAGQVGSGVRLADLLTHGNVRELMTAFYNGAYYNRASPHTLSKTLVEVIDRGQWEQARAIGVDVEALREMGGRLDSGLGRAVRWLEEKFSTEHRFARDPMATGHAVASSPHPKRDLAEVFRSQLHRTDRPLEEQLTLARTAEDYRRLGVPLGHFERAFVERHVEGEFTDGTPLPWREGATIHSNSGGWVEARGRDGFPVIDGVSATTTKMLLAARYLGLHPAEGRDFLGAVMGWMLPGQDHSMLEVLRGAETAGFEFGGLRPPGHRFTAVEMYHNLPGIDLHTLRTQILPDGLFPHEAVYLSHANDPAGFSETQHPKVKEIADRLWPQLRDGRVTDADLAEWLRHNGIDPANHAAVRALGERLSEAHVKALTVYTRHSHYLINNAVAARVLTFGLLDSVVEARHHGKVDELTQNYLENLARGTKALPLPLAMRPVLHHGEGHLDSTSALNPHARDWIDAQRRVDAAQREYQEMRAAGRDAEAQAARRAERVAMRDQRTAWAAIESDLAAVKPRLFEEVRWHADMAYEALRQLPAVGSPEHPVLAYRGDWMPRVWSPNYGGRLVPDGTATSFLSVSHDLDVAVRFMSENPAGGQKVIVVYRLTGVHARDLSVFSSFASDREAVLPPGAGTRRVSDPDLAELVNSRLPEEWRDRCRIIVMVEKGA